MAPGTEHMAAMTALTHAIEEAFFETRTKQLHRLDGFDLADRIKVISCSVSSAVNTIARQTAKEIAAGATAGEEQVKELLLKAIVVCLDEIRGNEEQPDA